MIRWQESGRIGLICASISLRKHGSAFTLLAILSALQTLRWYSVDGSSLQIEPGWFAPLYGVKQNAPVVSAVIEGKSSAEFVTVVMPSDPSRRAPELKVLHSPGAASPDFALEISGTGRDGAFTDYVAWSPSITDHDVSSFQCRASAVWSRSAGQKEDARFVACNVQECRSNQDDQIQFAAPSQPAAWVSWDPQHGWTSGAERFE